MDELTVEQLQELRKILNAQDPDAIQVLARAARYMLGVMVLQALAKKENR
jgi:succinate dehydrogenase flavin-adding protein (antitoxin of CptAB toxin-antitoxin module)